MNNCIIYRHIRFDKNEPFYIGIANNLNRPYDKNGRNDIWNKIVTKNNGEYRVDIFLEDLTWQEACEKEKEFIALYGRKNLGTGILSNLTDGGEGGDTFTTNPNKEEIREKLRQNTLKHADTQKVKAKETRIKNGTWGLKPTEEVKLKRKETGIKNGTYGVITEESKQKLSVITTSLWQDPEYRQKCIEGQSNKILSTDHKDKIRKTLEGRPKSEEHIQKLIAAAALRPLITCPHCDISSTNKTNMNRWHFNNCKQIENNSFPN